ncbi:hypothetical protein FGO68_gene12945 [Halteria grandinella]|uniref:2Fe-2S ferredoxin-type domain-containing protein n=1 Tax=Halteria grandinella TaxID=5974 RepID=A0A8J8T3W9_HALGN|nr:hypothetical protein FGO68_gene12945 [Halteria grandinella]
MKAIQYLAQPRFTRSVTFTVYRQNRQQEESLQVNAEEGKTLMDVLSECKQIKELDEFGLCGGELSCHTCRVHIRQGYAKIGQKPTVEEEDCFSLLGRVDYIEGVTRMACQIKVSKEMEGAVIEIPDEAFTQL